MEILKLEDCAETRSLVSKLAKREFGEEGKLTCLGGGWFGLCWKVNLTDGTKRVIKAYRVRGMNRTQALETEILAKHCTLPMPKTLFLHDSDKEIPLYAMGMEFMEGKIAISVPPTLFNRKKRRACGVAVVDALYAIHTAQNDKFGFVENAESETWLAFYRPLAEEVYSWVSADENRRGLSDAVYGALSKGMEFFDQIFAETVLTATLVHADLNVANFLVDEKTLAPNALIDPFGTVWGDLDYDLHQLYNIGGNRFFLYETYKARHPVSSTCDLKCAFYALFNEVRCYMLAGIKSDYVFPRMVRNFGKQLKKFGIGS